MTLSANSASAICTCSSGQSVRLSPANGPSRTSTIVWRPNAQLTSCVTVDWGTSMDAGRNIGFGSTQGWSPALSSTRFLAPKICALSLSKPPCCVAISSPSAQVPPNARRSRLSDSVPR